MRERERKGRDKTKLSFSLSFIILWALLSVSTHTHRDERPCVRFVCTFYPSCVRASQREREKDFFARSRDERNDDRTRATDVAEGRGDSGDINRIKGIQCMKNVSITPLKLSFLSAYAENKPVAVKLINHLTSFQSSSNVGRGGRESFSLCKISFLIHAEKDTLSHIGKKTFVQKKK